MVSANYKQTKITAATAKDVTAAIEELKKREAAGEQLPKFLMTEQTHNAKLMRIMPDFTASAKVLGDPKYLMRANELSNHEIREYIHAQRVAVDALKAIDKVRDILRMESMESISYKEYTSARGLDTDEELNTFSSGLLRARYLLNDYLEIEVLKEE